MSELYPLIDPYVEVLEEYFRLVCELWLERVEAKLQIFAEALDAWLHDLFQHPKPDWRDRFDAFVSEQEAAGRTVMAESRQDLLDFLESWSATVDWSAAEPSAVAEREQATNDRSDLHLQPSAALRYVYVASDDGHVGVDVPPATKPRSGSGRGDQSQFSRQAEEIVSEATGVPRNHGPGQQRIPGSGPGGFQSSGS